MGKLARLRAAGVTGFGVGTGNPVKNQLVARYTSDRNRNVQFSDRRYHIDKHGTFKRLGVPKPKDEHGQRNSDT